MYNPSRRLGQSHIYSDVKVNFLTIFALTIFILAFTRTEFTDFGRGEGLAHLFRACCATGVMLVVAVQTNTVSVKHLVASLFISSYFAFFNTFSPTLFSLVAPTAIISGLLLASLALVSINGKDFLTFLVRACIIFNLTGLAFSFLFYYGLGLKIDLHHIIFPWSHARLHDFFGYYRITGFQVEPGTYSNTMFFLVFISALLRKRIFGRLELIATFSTLATFSAWSIIFFVTYIFSISIEYLRVTGASNLALRYILLLPILIFIAVSLFLVSESEYAHYYMLRYSTDGATGSISEKVLALDAWLENFGPRTAFGRAMPETFCPHCSSPQDLGMIFNFIYFFGFIASAAIFSAFYVKLFRNYGVPFIIASAPLLLVKHYYYDSIVWFTLGLSVFSSRFSGGSQCIVSNWCSSISTPGFDRIQKSK